MRWLLPFLWVLALGCGDAGETSDPCRDIICDDNDACTVDKCHQGECRYIPVVCDDRNLCTEDTCDPVSGCETTLVDDGTPCGDGARVCEAGTCVGDFRCTEQGIRDAIAEGGGPHTFECEGPTTVSTSETIFISRSVILDGEDNLIVHGTDHHRVFDVSGGVVALRRMTITGGRVETSNGGGIENGGRLTLVHVTVSDNTATYAGSSLFRGTGGGIYNTGTLTLTDSTVSGNVAAWDGRGDHCGIILYVPCGGHGGGIENEGGSVTLTRTTVDGNTATVHGGGIENSDGGTLALTNSTVSDNTAEWGGAIYNDFDGTLTLTNSAVSGNAADYGGGILNHDTLMLTNSMVSGNTAYSGGGISNVGSGTLTLTNSLVSGNAAHSSGGIGNSGAAILTNSTVSGNTATSEGGGIRNNDTLTLLNSTVSGNAADVGSGISNVGSGTLTLTNSLVDGDCDGDIASNGYNIESPDNTCSFDQAGDQSGITEVQLNLGELADNGGPTMTHKPGDGGLGEGSVAIDQIPGDACDLTEDQRGQPRPETDGTMCDVGSIEVQPEL